MSEKKSFVLDTNVLLHNAECIESFADNAVVIPMAVIEELDKFKSQSNELGRNARQVIRRLDLLREKGNLRDGVPLGSGGVLKIMSQTFPVETSDLDEDIPDNRILSVATELHRAGQRVIFVSKDINARIKADALGIEAQDFEKEKINFDELYAGYCDVDVSPEVISAFFATNVLEGVDDLGRYPNEFLCMRSENGERKTALARTVQPGTISHLSSKNEKIWNVQARNREQRMAIELLMDPDVQLVTLVGMAGTGKTLLALAAALHCTMKYGRYDCVLVSRPVVPLGKDIGYLPGDKEEKLAHWMQPIFDNLSYLLRPPPPTAGKKKKSTITTQQRIEKLIKDNTLILEALTYIRGRSIPRQYVIVDEAQNLTPHEVKTIISRAGEGTKMVLTGDPYQIDNPYLDASSNGLTYVAERMKMQRLHGHLTLRTSERSALAAVAAESL